jgi:cobyrinic acid a,c-diamide synthase
MSVARLLVSAPGSSSGKSLLSMLLLVWARERGLKPAAFKCGPDYLDTQYLEACAQKPAHNLDSWMMGSEAAVQEVFHYGALHSSLAVVEGAMGLLDGRRGAAFGQDSTLSVAQAIQAPVVLVADARKAGVSLAASLAGVARAAGAGVVQGVVLNRPSGKQHAALLKKAILEHAGLPCLGWLPNEPGISIPERHLGLQALSETADLPGKILAALPQLGLTLDFEGLLALARSAPELPSVALPLKASGPGKARIAVAKDAAFHFYYHDNLRRLEAAGAELAFFSPLKDACLPEGCSGLLIGGGFPESFAPALAQNEPLKQAVRDALKAGMPYWAECGGLMWLCQSLEDLEGRAWPMVGWLMAKAAMQPKLQGFGYRQARALSNNGLYLAESWARGHEFHHSKLEWIETGSAQPAWQLAHPDDRRVSEEGYKKGQGIATYLHMHFASQPQAPLRFVQACKSYSGS